MAFLMLLHEKMRLQRKIIKLTLKQLHFGNLVERQQRQTDKREKYYSKLEKQIERQASSYMNMANNTVFSNGMAGFNPNSIFASGGCVGYTPTTQQAIARAAQELNLTGKENLIALYMQNSMAFKSAGKDASGNEIKIDGEPAYKVDGYSDNISTKDLGLIQQAAQYARYSESSYNQYINAAKQQYQEQINEWKQAQLDQLDMQKEWEMDLLAEEQDDLEAEKTSVESQLELAKQRKEAIESELGNSIKDAAPKFGLG